MLGSWKGLKHFILIYFISSNSPAYQFNNCWYLGGLASELSSLPASSFFEGKHTDE